MSRLYHPHGDRRNIHGCLVRPSATMQCRGIAHAFANAEIAEQMFAGETWGYMYHGTSRGQEIVAKLEEAITIGEAHEQAHDYDTFATASGMSAISLLYHQIRNATQKNEIILSPYVYGGVYNHLVRHLQECGFICHVIDEDALDTFAWERKAKKCKKLIGYHIETPSNPTCDVFDIFAFSESAHKYGAWLICDNTLATFALQRPLLHRADIVVNSLTKGISGHSEELAGTVTAPREFMDQMRMEWGAGMRPVLSPGAAERIFKHLPGLAMRMRQYSQNASALIRVLAEHPQVRGVRAPFMGRRNFVINKRQMADTGGLLQMDLSGGKERAYTFLNALRRVLIAPHFGHNRTLAIAPRYTTHSKIPARMQDEIGITESSIRISVGCNSERDFKKDIDDILQAIEVSWKAL